jgi:hypothetical protein
MFAELDRRGYLRKGLQRQDRQKLLEIWRLSNRFGEALNYLNTLFSPTNPCRQIQTDTLEAVGMTQNHLTSLWMQSMISNFLVNIESVFRFTLVFFLNSQFFKDNHLRPKYATTNQLLTKIAETYSHVGYFREAFNLNLRDSFAHGSFWFSDNELHYTSDPHLTVVNHMSLADFMKTSMKTNVAAHAFIDVLDSEINEGMFRG